ncbi:10288_t:CDS:2, partial [Diversispora eburnea]
MSLSRNFRNFENQNAIKLVNTIWQCLDNLIDPPLKKNNKKENEQDLFEGELFLDENTLNERLEYLNDIVTEKRRELGVSDSKLEQAFHNARLNQRRHTSINEVFGEVLNQFNSFIGVDFNLTFKTSKMLNGDDDDVTLKSFKALKSSNKKFDEVLAGHKDHFMLYLNNLELDINKIVELLQLSDQIFSNRQYEKFQKRLRKFLETTQNLMTLLKLITVQCDDETSFLEDNKSILEKVEIGATIVGGLAFLIGTAIAADTSSSEKTRKYGKTAAALGGATLAATGLSHFFVHNKIEKSIGYQKRMIRDLTKIHENLFEWDIRSNQIKEKDYDEMDSHTRQQLVLVFQ